MRPWRATRIAALAAALCAAAAPAGAAEVRRIQALGVAPLAEDAGPAAPRDAAVRAAAAQAVAQVARELLPTDFDAPPPGEPGADAAATPDERLAGALGDDPFAYAERFRILEDRGERAAVQSEDPEVEREYVVLAEISVNVTRVEERLRQAGLLDAPAGGPRVTSIRLELQGVDSYGAYAAVRQALLDDPAVTEVQPQEIERGRTVLAVESDGDVEGLLSRLVRSAPPGLQLVPLESEAESVVLLVEWTPPAPAAPDAADEPLPD